jgi:hypothetical protein
MICNFLVTVTLMVSGPTKNNTQGVLKIQQYNYSEFIKANELTRRYLLSIGAGIESKDYPKTIGIDLVKTSDFKCNYDGEQRTFK